MAHDTALATYRSILAPHLGKGFAIGELVKPGNRRLTLPPSRLMANMLPTLELANELRRRCLAADVGISGLRVHAAYRPSGGASRSKHLSNAALDLDLKREEYAAAGAFNEIAALLWRELGDELTIGLGFYCRAGGRSIRAHLDAAKRTRATTWQMSGGAYIKPPLAKRILANLDAAKPRRPSRSSSSSRSNA